MAIFRTLKKNLIRFKERVFIWLSYWKASKRMYDFDYTCVLEAEHHQLKRLIRCIDKWRSHENVERDLFWMRICDYLLEVILRDPLSNKKDFYCNTKNYKRFFPNMTDKMLAKLSYFGYDLYEQKAWHLYHKIRERHMQSWWD